MVISSSQVNDVVAYLTKILPEAVVGETSDGLPCWRLDDRTAWLERDDDSSLRVSGMERGVTVRVRDHFEGLGSIELASFVEELLVAPTPLP